MNSINEKQLKTFLAEGYNILDLRKPEQLELGFIKQSIAVDPEYFQLLEWVGQLLYYPVDKTILVVDSDQQDVSKLHEAIGLPIDTSIYLWHDASAVIDAEIELDMVIPVSADEFVLDVKHDKNIEIVDLRSQEEYQKAHLKEAISIKWEFSAAIIQEYEPNDKLYLLSPISAISWAVATLLRFNNFNFVRPIVANTTQLDELGLTITRKKKN